MTMHSNKKIWVDGRLEKLGKAWIEWSGRKEMKAIDFNPNGTPSDTYNMYQPSPIKAVAGACNLYIDHIYNVIASGNKKHGDYILDFMADAVQNPGKRPGVALVFRGVQGAGKGIFVKYFSKLFEPHYAHVTSSDQIFGRFNSLAMNKLLIYFDEASWGGDKEKEGRLKALVTEDTIVIEQKNREPIIQKNFARLIFSSNNKWVIAAGDQERRFCVLDVSDKQARNSTYFAAIADQMENGGLEALMYLLKNRDISNVDIRDFPKTSALDEQKRRNYDAIQGWWSDCLFRGCVLPTELDPAGFFAKWESPVPIEKCYQSLGISAKQRQVKNHLSETEFGIELKRLMPSLNYKRITVQNEYDGNDLRPRKRAYVFPSLQECREHFDNLMGTQTDWPVVD